MSDESKVNLKFYEKNWFMWLMLIFISPIGIFLMWKNKKFNVIIRGVLSVFFVFWFVAFIQGFNQPKENTSKQSTSKQSTEVNEEVQKGKETAKFYKMLVENLNDVKPSLEDKSFNLIKNNYDLFPIKNKKYEKEIKTFLDNKVQYKHLDKNIKNYLETMISIEGRVIQISEEEIDGKKVSLIHIFNNNRENFQIIYLGTNDILKGDQISCIGLPVALNCFKNVSGGATKTVVLIGSKLNKLNQ